MPTGYTHMIGNRDDLTFKEFALQCARNFGALIMMRDEPSNAPIPEKFEPSDYNSKEIARIRTEIKRISALDDQQADACAHEEFQKQSAAWLKRGEEQDALQGKYSAMLAQVKMWTPPTEDHQGLKDFMIQQITDSIEWDCPEERSKYDAPPERISGMEWKVKALDRLEKDLEYHQKSHLEEIERVKSRNEWIAALRKSLEE